MQKVVPAILTKSSQELQAQLRTLKDKSRWVQIDIMDGKFVPSVSINLVQLQEASQFFNLEIHLMVKDPEKYLEDCAGVRAKRVIFHVEASENSDMVLEEMQKYDFQKGIAVNPLTSVEAVKHLMFKIDSVLLLSVVPGAQGHEFIPEVTEKISDIKALNEKLLVGMDGGIGKGNIQDIFTRGVDYIIAGSAIWQADDSIASLRELQGMVS